VLTAEGADWRRHRKVTSPPFTERNLSIVFRASIQQTTTMRSVWRRKNGQSRNWMSVRSFSKAIKALVMNVFGVAALGIRPEEASDILWCLAGLTQSIPLVHLADRFLPKWLVGIGSEVLRERLEMRETLWRQFQSLIENAELCTTTTVAKGSLLESFLKQRIMSCTKEERFTDAEIAANLWIFNVGGYETTSNAMEFLVLALALHPQKQAWLRTELRKSLLPDDPARWKYEPTMSAFTAAICVVYEALRLFPTQPTILRWTEDQYLTIAGHIVPPNTAVQLSCTGLHRNPKYWGRDADEFVPDRWNGRNDNEDGEDAAKRRFPTVRSPPVKGAFLPWG
jgi:cytochrome P450